MAKRKVFVSYSREDRMAADAIANRLRSKGFLVFMDTIAIVAGKSYSDTIDQEIRSASAVVVLLSSRSQQSKWLNDEVQAALDSKALVLSILLDEHAKDNWLWPLLATRPSVELDLTSRDVESQLDNVARRLSVEIRGPARARAKRYASSIAGAAVYAALGAFIAWLLQKIL
jgi:hypothetical protein